ncbi:hypothetical protein [Corynebacterium dentalis]|nr:hypothetical protein [Corynebacterium dentalis]
MRRTCLLSYYLDISSGGTIVSVQSAIFAAAFLFTPREGLVTRWFIRAGA